MAQQLWLLRHGEAEPYDARPDADRRLTDRGREQSRIAGCALAALKVQVHLCFTSPKVRARDTAVLACEALGVRADRSRRAVRRASTSPTRSSSWPPPAPTSACSWSATSPTSPRSSTTSPAARVDFKKGGIAAVRLDGTRGELIALLRPRELERICAGAS